MNPNICTICELMFTRIRGGRTISVDVSVLFADLRGYTTLSQLLPFDAVSSLLDVFYDECAEAIWEHDGLLNKTLGDAVMAIFNFPIEKPDHAEQALRAAREIQRRCGVRFKSLLADHPELSRSELGVGIGIDCGSVTFGEFGRSHRDLTAIGTVVNTAARAQAATAAGQILVTQSIRDRIGAGWISGEGRAYDLKGFENPVTLYPA